MFLDKLYEKEGHKNALLVMHCDPFDSEGPLLLSVIEKLGVKDNVYISKDKLPHEQINVLYNCFDWNICISSAEGFGLNILVSKLCGVPSIIQKTGGMADQIVDDDGNSYGIFREPDVKTLTGTHQVPYIEDNFLSWDSISDMIFEAHSMSDEDYDKLCELCFEDAKNRFGFDSMISDWDKSINDCIDKFIFNKGAPKYTIECI
jgi:glycosyltransferase involved in cell wall biosynthesis